MRIGYLLRTFPQLSQTFILNEIDELERCGHSVSLAAIYRPGEGVDTSLRRFEERTLYWFDIDKSLLIWILSANMRRMFLSPVQYAHLLLQYRAHGFEKFLKKVALAEYFVQAGVSHIHTHFAWEQVDLLRFIKRLTGIPYSITLHAADIFSEVYNLSRSVLESSFSLTISEYNRQHLISEYKIPPQKIRVVHCGVDPDDFPVSDTHTNDEIPEILSIGRMVDKKGFDILLNALKILKDKNVAFQARLIGDGPLLAELKERRDKLGLKNVVTFTGSQPHDIVKTALVNCDFFALACRQTKEGDIDGIPVVLMEAMAAGHPVISTRISGIPELVQEGSGFLVEPEDAYSMAQGLQQLIAEQKQKSMMGKKGREIIEKEFSIKSQVKGLLENVQKEMELL